MNLVVVVREVPDIQEELEVAADGKDIDRTFISFVMNEFDEQALEEALVLKEEGQADSVLVAALDGEGVDDILYTALAKGADEAVKVIHGLEPPIPTRVRAALLAAALKSIPHDLIFTGVQSAEDWDGQLAPLLGAALDYPWVEVVTAVRLEDGLAVVEKEFKGGLRAELEVRLPAVLGIQAATKPPRYAPVSRIRQLMRTATLKTVEVNEMSPAPAAKIRRLSRPVASRSAEFIEGSLDEVVEGLLSVFRNAGVLRGEG